MAKDIPRATLRQMVRDYSSHGFLSTSGSGAAFHQSELLIYNSTNSTIPVGGAIKVSGYPASISYDAAIGKLINGELILNGVASSGSDDSMIIATALEPIASGAVGRVKADVVFARVHYNAPSSGESEYAEASSTFELVKTGTFKVIAQSQKNAGNYMICALTKKSGSLSSVTKVDIAYFPYVANYQDYLAIQHNNSSPTQFDAITGVTFSGNEISFTYQTIKCISPSKLSVVTNVQ
jgi:hypothetical protein